LNNDFYEQVYGIVESIPSGKVVTYGQIARALGRPQNSRAVGYAMKKSPAERKLPCHRVVSSSGKLAPSYIFGDKQHQRAILLDEGVEFSGDGFQINLKKSKWQEL